MKFGLFFVLQRPDHLTERAIYESEMAQMLAAESLGFHSVWIAEHHFSNYGVCSAPQVLGAAIAGQTKRLRIGMGITLMPLHDPVQLAEELAVLDLLSGGRLDVGIGRASTNLEYRGYGIPYEESRARVDEGVIILRGLWTQDCFSYAGRFRQVQAVSLVPKPLQKPHPPLYFACNSAETVPIAAHHGLPMMTSTLVSEPALIERREIYRQVSAEAGYPAAEVEARLTQTWTSRFVYLAENERDALNDPKEHLIGYQDAAGERVRSVNKPDHRAGFTYEERLREGSAFFGTPDQVADRIAAFHERTGVENLLCFMSFRALDRTKALRSMELFAARVMPQFVATPTA